MTDNLKMNHYYGYPVKRYNYGLLVNVTLDTIITFAFYIPNYFFVIAGSVNGVERPERDIQSLAAARRSNGKTNIP